jgi:kynureninase
MRLGEQEALALDAADPLARFRERFELPPGRDGRPVVYLAGNSLGLMPRAAREYVARELDDWAGLGVDGHFHAANPWYGYHETLRDPLARLVGALPSEVVAMNSLTVNLHLMMATFYRPTAARHAILVEEHPFPSDLYAAQSQAKLHGLDPATSVIVASEETILETLDRRGDEIAVVMLSGVQYYSGRLFDIPAITKAAHARGCVVGWDLAHAAGNVPLKLHDWDVDFAAWCSYKYLNAGPGAIAGCFVHERHATDVDRPRMGGWWGNDPETRFRMHLNDTFVPRATADGWQLSNPPILAMAPLRASLELFDEAGIGALRSKSLRLTAFLEALLDAVPGSPFEILTPRDPEARGCQLSLRVKDRPRERFAALEAAGIVADFRPPEVIRVAPVPLYNSFHDVWRAAGALAEVGA